MNQQSKIDAYFKLTKPNLDSCDMDKKIKKNKRYSLSLIKPVTPTKISKASLANFEPDVILLSDDELSTPNSSRFLTQTSENMAASSSKLQEPSVVIRNDSVDSDSPNGTIIYNITNETPPKAPQSRTPSSNNCSPNSKYKFFSPTKKRCVMNKSPVKRNLSLQLNLCSPPVKSIDDDFKNACYSLGDKTVFLLTIIYKYLNDNTLRHMLDENSEALLSNAMGLVKPGMTLVCRLFWCKDRWYRMDEVRKMSTEGREDLDDPNLQLMLGSLIQHGYLTSSLQDNNITLEEYTNILRSNDIKQICKDLKLKCKTKQDGIEKLKDYCRQKPITTHFKCNIKANSERLMEILRAKAGSCYRLTNFARTTLYKLHVLMYLGIDFNYIREKKLELMLINDKIKRETFPVPKDMVVDDASTVFQTNYEFDRYMAAHYIYENYLEVTDVNEKNRIINNVYDRYKAINEEDMTRYKELPQWLRRFTPAYLYVKILDCGIKELKRTKSETKAVEVLTTLIAQDLFRQHKKMEWYAEKALILKKLEGSDQAAQVLLEGLKSNMSEEDKDSLRQSALKIAKQKSAPISHNLKEELIMYGRKESILEKNLKAYHIFKQPMENSKRGGKLKFETRIAEGRQVQTAEEYCISHYILNEGFTGGEHCEGKIIMTIFLLLFWDIIYTKPIGVRGIFLSHYQQYPCDFFYDDFYKNRKIEIDNWLTAIENSSVEKLLKIMEDTWNSRPETELSGVWRAGGWRGVRAAAAALGAGGVGALCRRLASAPRRACAGFPDLTLWDEHDCRIKFVEVKTDLDKPSLKQIQWMNYLQENGIDTEFCYVGANTTRQKARASCHTKTKNISTL